MANEVEQTKTDFAHSNYECESCREEKPDVIDRTPYGGNGYYCDECWPKVVEPK